MSGTRPDHGTAREPAGALVISLDFELQWGVRERMRDGGYRRNLDGAREAVPRMLELFAEFEVAATWATVGFLFARSRAERAAYAPVERPTYADAALDPYGDETGESERDDPWHHAATLVERILATPRQELATHTFSHYYCREPGQTATQFDADLGAARAIAAARDVALRSIVFPRNQHEPAYDVVLLRQGIVAYRGNPRSWMWRFGGAEESAAPARRLLRLLDGYVGVGVAASQRWDEVVQPSGLSDVRASRFLAPYRPALRHLEPLRLRRIRQELRRAAAGRQLYHLWWHPHNFGAHPGENLDFLHRVLQEYARCRERFGMLSLSMSEVDRLARERSGAPSAFPVRRTPPGNVAVARS